MKFCHQGTTLICNVALHENYVPSIVQQTEKRDEQPKIWLISFIIFLNILSKNLMSHLVKIWNGEQPLPLEVNGNPCTELEKVFLVHRPHLYQ